MDVEAALLQVGDNTPVEVTSGHQLCSLLEQLSILHDGRAVTLRRSPSDFIRASPHRELWAVEVKRSGMWFAQSFTAGMTTEYSDRRARESRQVRSFLARITWWLRSPPPERALSAKQVCTLFGEYLADKKFTLPFFGA